MKVKYETGYYVRVKKEDGEGFDNVDISRLTENQIIAFTENMNNPKLLSWLRTTMSELVKAYKVIEELSS